VNGLRGRLEAYWASNALHSSPAEDKTRDDDSSFTKPEKPSSDGSRSTTHAPRKRSVQPFIFAHDFPRGIVYMFQATLTYALMLIVMTFQVAYFVSIVAGLGVGEVMFGRWGR